MSINDFLISSLGKYDEEKKVLYFRCFSNINFPFRIIFGEYC